MKNIYQTTISVYEKKAAEYLKKKPKQKAKTNIDKNKNKCVNRIHKICLFVKEKVNTLIKLNSQIFKFKGEKDSFDFGHTSGGDQVVLEFEKQCEELNPKNILSKVKKVKSPEK